VPKARSVSTPLLDLFAHQMVRIGLTIYLEPKLMIEPLSTAIALENLQQNQKRLAFSRGDDLIYETASDTTVLIFRKDIDLMQFQTICGASIYKPAYIVALEYYCASVVDAELAAIEIL
jgi:hypothetical protein